MHDLAQNEPKTDVPTKAKRGCLGRAWSFTWRAVIILGIFYLGVSVGYNMERPGSQVAIAPTATLQWTRAPGLVITSPIRSTPQVTSTPVSSNTPLPTITSLSTDTLLPTATVVPTLTNAPPPTSTATPRPSPTTPTSLSTNMPVALEVDDSEYAALAVFYASTRGENWVNNDGWLEGSPCEWYGITCRDGHIIYISLPENNLTGELSSSLGDLSYMIFLELNKNNLSGTLPSSLGNLSNLEWFGASNNPELSGNIPSEFANLLNLKTLSLRNNQMSGELPISLINLELDRLWVEGSNLCAPVNVDFQQWLTGIDDLIVATCE